MRPLCEAVALEVLPAVRSLLAATLHKKGMRNKEIAAKMGVTPAAVTQYLKKSRGSKTKPLMRNKKVKTKVDALAEKMMRNPSAETVLFCDMCKGLRNEIIPNLYGKGDIIVPKGC